MGKKAPYLYWFGSIYLQSKFEIGKTFEYCFGKNDA